MQLIGMSPVDSLQPTSEGATGLESTMDNVIQFQARTVSLGQPNRNIDVTVLAWIPLGELRELLWRWDATEQSTPDLLRQCVRIVAEALVEDSTDAEARKRGWHGAAAMHERGRDMLSILAEEMP